MRQQESIAEPIPGDYGPNDFHWDKRIGGLVPGLGADQKPRLQTVGAVTDATLKRKADALKQVEKELQDQAADLDARAKALAAKEAELSALMKD